MYELMRGGRFLLLDGTDDRGVAHAAEEDWTGRVDIVRVLVSTAADLPAVLLVRPDGYAAWATNASAPEDRLAAACAALRSWCGPAIVDREKSERHGTL